MLIIYTPEDIATRWHVSEITVCRMLQAGKLKGFKAGRFWRIPESALLAYEAGQQ